ncbi:MAG: hypothetical protein IPJ41_11110 [Phycisphaerales bacterium]|nr:hypothetical protein [Phycisphaerales bacterium]
METPPKSALPGEPLWSTVWEYLIGIDEVVVDIRPLPGPAGSADACGQLAASIMSSFYAEGVKPNLSDLERQAGLELVLSAQELMLAYPDAFAAVEWTAFDQTLEGVGLALRFQTPAPASPAWESGQCARGASPMHLPLAEGVR